MKTNTNILQSTDYFNNATYPNDISFAINDEIKVSKSLFHCLDNLTGISDPYNIKKISATATESGLKSSEEMVFRPSLLNNTSTLELNEQGDIKNLQGKQKYNVPASCE